MDEMTSDIDTDPIQQVIQAFADGELVVLLDHPSREGEADLILAAEFATGEKLNILATVARGLIALAITGQRLGELGIPMIQPVNCAENWPHFAEPVDYTVGTTTGASAFDLAATARAFTDPEARPEHFARPGHLLPLREDAGGMTGRAGHTEGAVGLARLAGLCPAAVICEIMAPDGTMASGEALKTIISENNFPATTVQQIAEASAQLL